MKEKKVALEKSNVESQINKNIHHDSNSNCTANNATEKLKEITNSTSRTTNLSVLSELQKTLDQVSTPRIFNTTDKLQEMIASVTAASAPIATHNIQNIIESLAKPIMTDTIQEMIASITVARAPIIIPNMLSDFESISSLHAFKISNQVQEMIASLTSAKVPSITSEILNTYSLFNTTKAFNAANEIHGIISGLGIDSSFTNSTNIQKIISSTELNSELYSASNIINIIQSAQDNFSFDSISKIQGFISSSQEIFNRYGIDIDESIKEIEKSSFNQTINSASGKHEFTDSSLTHEQIRNRSVVIMLFIAMMFKSIIEQTIANIASSIIQSKFINQETSLTKKKAEQLISESELYDKTKFRLIIAHQLYVRDEPSIKSPIVDTLQKGNIVLVLSKNKNWIEIGYKSLNDEFITGWVFTRYTKALN